MVCIIKYDKSKPEKKLVRFISVKNLTINPDPKIMVNLKVIPPNTRINKLAIEVLIILSATSTVDQMSNTLTAEPKSGGFMMLTLPNKKSRVKAIIATGQYITRKSAEKDSVLIICFFLYMVYKMDKVE